MPSVTVDGLKIEYAESGDQVAPLPGAELKIIRGMGHDLPAGLVPILVDAIAAHCRRADRRAAENADKTIGSAR